MTRHNIYRSDNSDPETLTEENPEAKSPSPVSPSACHQSVAHHNPSTPDSLNLYYRKGVEIERRYGVPQPRRILTMGMFHKYHDEILHQLTWLGLETRERDAIFKLLELYR
jgi:hypothetical protein